MELSVKMNSLDLSIVDNNVQFSKVVNMMNVCDIMIFLQSQIDLLRCYKKGMKMGRDNMHKYINKKGHYRGHNGMTAGDHDLDV